MRKAKKQMVNLLDTTMIGSAASLGLAGIGGNVATSGEMGISRLMGFAPAIGSTIGAGMVVRQVGSMEKSFKKPKKRKRRR